MSKEEIIEKLIGMLSANTGVPEREISKDSDLTNGSVDMDSMDFMELISDIDVEFDTHLINFENKQLRTIDMIADRILEQKNEHT